MADKAKELAEKIDRKYLQANRMTDVWLAPDNDIIAALIREAIRPLVEAAESVYAIDHDEAEVIVSLESWNRLREELKGWSLQISDGANEKRK